MMDGEGNERDESRHGESEQRVGPALSIKGLDLFST